MARRFDVLCVGLQVIDLLVTGADRCVFDQETTNVENIELLLGGDALNQAITLSALGAKTGLMGAVGNDALGDVLMNRLAAYPIEVLNRRIDAKTGISIVLCRTDGERHFVLQTGHNERFCYEHIDEQAVRDAGVVSIGSCMGMKAMDGADTLRLLELASSAGATTAMDFKITHGDYDMPRVYECIRTADYLLPSEGDAAKLTGEKHDPKRMVEGLRDLGARNLILKLGDRGCYVAADGVEMQIPACASSCVDTTGAGDTFAAAFLYGKCRGWDVETCARFANAAGAIAVETRGANGAVRSEAQVRMRMEAGR